MARKFEIGGEIGKQVRRLVKSGGFTGISWYVKQIYDAPREPQTFITYVAQSPNCVVSRSYKLPSETLTDDWILDCLHCVSNALRVLES